MTNIKDQIVVEFARNQSFFHKTTLSEFSKRKMKEWADGNIDHNRFVVAVYETEEKADEYIKENKGNMEKFCLITSMDNLAYLI